ncbi:MAG: efflux RND transporter permease subunit, partial [Candidatus Xenobia bacterium]
MSWNISAWAIRRPIPSLVLFLVLIVGGLYCFWTLGIDADPNIDLPYVIVTIADPGAAPVEIEAEITRRVESAIIGLGSIKHITSTVSDGSSQTVIEFEFGTNTDQAVNDVRDAVTRVQQYLPQNIPAPIVQRATNTGEDFTHYTVYSKIRDVRQLSWLIDNDISRAVLAVPGVGALNRHGGVDREIHVDLDPMALEAVGLTPDGVSGQIRALNINLPGGRGDIGQRLQAVRTLGSANTVDQLAAWQVALGTPGAYARLDSLGKVYDTSQEPQHRALLNGRTVVTFGVQRAPGSNLVDVQRGVDKALATLMPTLPKDIEIHQISTDADYVKESYRDSLNTLWIGAALAVLVIWIFLRDWKAALISALAMPISVIPTFIAMRWADFTLNGMTLLGLSLVIGILVDDAIVEIENIVRHIAMGKKPFDAAIEAADEIGLAVVATTMSIIVVFLPVSCMGGIPGQYFKPFGMTVAMAVFFSLVVARLLTPMMAAYWMGAHQQEQGESPMTRLYDRLLHWVLRYRFATIAGAMIVFGIGLWLFSTIPTSLTSAVDQGYFGIRVTTPPGSTLDETTAACARMSEILRKHPEVDQVYCSIGDPTSAWVRVKLVPKNQRLCTQQEFQEVARRELRVVPGVRMQIGAGWGQSFTVILASENDADLKRSADALMKDMRGMDQIADVNSDASLQRPEIEVIPDPARAAEQGVSVAAIANTAQIAALGDMDANLPKFDLPDRQINIRVELDPKFRTDLQTIRNLKVMNSAFKLV